MNIYNHKCVRPDPCTWNTRNKWTNYVIKLHIKDANIQLRQVWSNNSRSQVYLYEIKF